MADEDGGDASLIPGGDAEGGVGAEGDAGNFRNLGTGDAVAVGAMVDRLVHHAEVIVLQGDSYRLKDRAKEVLLPDSH